MCPWLPVAWWRRAVFHRMRGSRGRQVRVGALRGLSRLLLLPGLRDKKPSDRKPDLRASTAISRSCATEFLEGVLRRIHDLGGILASPHGCWAMGILADIPMSGKPDDPTECGGDAYGNQHLPGAPARLAGRAQGKEAACYCVIPRTLSFTGIPFARAI